MKLYQLLSIQPSIARARGEAFLEPLNAAMARFGIDSPARQAAFVAQVLHESAYLTAMSENLNYSPASLMATFNTSKHQRFTQEMAAQYGRTAHHPADQQMIANIAYANRMGNGGIESGDGWRYRGRGPGQITGKANYALCGKALGLNLTGSPDAVAEPDVGCLAFAWYWTAGNPTGSDLSKLADRGDVRAISRAVNGGDNGLTSRLELTRRALEVLA